MNPVPTSPLVDDIDDIATALIRAGRYTAHICVLYLLVKMAFEHHCWRLDCEPTGVLSRQTVVFAVSLLDWSPCTLISN